MTRLLKLLLLCLVLAQSARADMRASMSFEESYDVLAAVLRNYIKGRVEKKFEPFFSAYVLAGEESAAQTATPFYMKMGAFAYAGPGVKLSWGNLMLFTDVRFRKFLVVDPSPNAPLPPLTDFQMVLAYDDYWYTAFSDQPLITGFAEVYSESAFTTADYSNIVHNTMFRVGTETPIIDKAYLGAYVEPNLFLDRIGHFYNNRADMRFSLRIRYAPRPLSFSLSASYLFNTYINVKRFENYGPPDRNQGFTMKLLMSVAL